MTVENRESTEYILCGCNCGAMMPKYDWKGRERKYLNREHSGRTTFKGKKHSDETKQKISQSHTKIEKASFYRQGYKYLYIPNHPNSSKDGYIGEHVYAMSQHLGRPLKKGEHTHHKNKNRADNRIENLELHTPSSHMQLHRLEYTESIIGRTCDVCGTNKTLINKKKDSKGKYYEWMAWRTNPLDRSQILCHRCYSRIKDRIKRGKIK
jgi:hypothetical protein